MRDRGIDRACVVAGEHRQADHGLSMIPDGQLALRLADDFEERQVVRR